MKFLFKYSDYEQAFLTYFSNNFLHGRTINVRKKRKKKLSFMFMGQASLNLIKINASVFNIFVSTQRTNIRKIVFFFVFSPIPVPKLTGKDIN